ncbi:DUF11 domain-containing protein [Acaryochloris sp. 'Moss Beach']|uniref:DUF11 domain-containing protein n=1 Tax=Acaryochloris sp. 'Moss Beach' TaxID=2740837 RepID=UPI001F18BDD8|nr:DUF11 domain-containing protein [Acaryochloris sp. 'Moss Beach']UJB68516.1 DUF11 domain-containing protein [Acaryochloris sp. 'Moss Beach']
MNKRRQQFRYALWLGLSLLTWTTATPKTIAATFPANSDLQLQTSGPLRCANIGDWYTTNGSSGGGACNGAATTSTDRIHRFVVDITPEMLAALGGSVTVSIEDAESVAGPGFIDEVSGTSDPTRFQLRTANGNTVLQTQTINPSVDGSGNNTTVNFTISAAGTYQITSETGAGPIFGDNTTALNNDDNSFRIRIPDVPGLPPASQGLVGQYQSTAQHNESGTLTIPFFFLVGPGTGSLFLRNFDIDNRGTLTYTRPDGSTIAGTNSGNGRWNNSGTLNTGGDTIAGLTLSEAGLWGLRVNNLSRNNQMIVEANTGTGDRLVLYNEPPTRAGDFTITPDTTLSTTIGVAVDHPFTVTNEFLTTDIINLNPVGTNANYTVQLLDASGNALTDTDGDGQLDTGILNPNQTQSFILRVTPLAGASTTDITEIQAISFMDQRVDPTNNKTLSITKTTTLQPPPKLVLVKRITAINGNRTINPNDNTVLNQFVDDVTTNDNEAGWPSNYLNGAFSGGLVRPGDEIEYTIYFLNAGGRPAFEVTICDRIQPFQTFKPIPFTASGDAEFQLGTSAVIPLTAANDSSDRAQFSAPNTAIPSECNLPGPNGNGTFVLNLTGNTGTGMPNLPNLPNSTGAGAPNNSYGLFRFRTTVDE